MAPSGSWSAKVVHPAPWAARRDGRDRAEAGEFEGWGDGGPCEEGFEGPASTGGNGRGKATGMGSAVGGAESGAILPKTASES